MITLLVVIFISFIGVGIPDSVLGTVWPAVYTEFDLPISLAGFISMTTSLGTVISSMLTSFFLRKLGTGGVVAMSTALTAISLLGFALSPHPALFFVLAIPLGLGAGCIDCTLNNFAALHYNATVMSMLHCFYGIGVALSPYLVSLALSDGNDWRRAYLFVAAAQGVITLVSVAALPLWKRARREEQSCADSVIDERLSVSMMLRMPAVCLSCLIFFFECAFELTAGGWFSTYLVATEGVPMNEAARLAMLFYIGLALGRFGSGVLARWLDAWRIMFFSTAVLLLALVSFFLVPSVTLKAILLFFFGFGVGPIFPNMTYLTPHNFGRAHSQSVINAQQASAYLGIMLMPSLFGLIAECVSVALYPVVLSVYFALYALPLLFLAKRLRGKGKKEV